MIERREVRERLGEQVFTLETLLDLDGAVDELLAREDERPGELERDLCPYFGVVWPSARALAAELSRRAPELARKSVLELGCGLALPSMVAVRAGARVTATDLHPEVPGFLERNLALNALSADALEYLELDWRTKTLPRRFDWVIASDILYECGHPEPVARALSAHLAPGGRILLADPARAYLQSAVGALEGLGLRSRIQVVSAGNPSPEREGDDTTCDVFLIELEHAS